MKQTHALYLLAALCAPASAAVFKVTATVQTGFVIEERSPLSFGSLTLKTSDGTALVNSETGVTHRLVLSPSGEVASHPDSALIPGGGATAGAYQIPLMPLGASVTLEGPGGALPVNKTPDESHLTCQYDSVEDAVADNRVVLQNASDEGSSFFCVDGFHSNEAHLFAPGGAREKTSATLSLGAVLISRTASSVHAPSASRYSNGEYVGQIELEIAL